MKNRCVKYFVCLFFCLFVSPLNIQASCDYQRVAELSKIASNVQFNYNYEIEDSFPAFYLNISNITNDIYVADNFGNVYERDVDHAAMISDQTYRFNIYSKDVNCYGEQLLIKYLKTPHFNTYSLSDFCINGQASNCGVWSTTTPLNDNNYNTISETQTEEVQKKDASWIKFLIIGVALILVIVVVIVFVKRKKKKIKK